MAKQSLHAVIYRDRDSEQWVAVCVEYEIATVGDSEKHALEMIQEAVELHLEDIGDEQLDHVDNAVASKPVIRAFKVRAPAILDG